MHFNNFKPAIDFYENFCIASSFVPSMATLKMAMIKYNGVSAYPYSYDYIKEQISQYNTNIANLINEISEI